MRAPLFGQALSLLEVGSFNPKVARVPHSSEIPERQNILAVKTVRFECKRREVEDLNLHATRTPDYGHLEAPSVNSCVSRRGTSCGDQETASPSDSA